MIKIALRWWWYIVRWELPAFNWNLDDSHPIIHLCVEMQSSSFTWSNTISHRITGRPLRLPVQWWSAFFNWSNGKIRPVYNVFYDFDEAFPVDLIAGAFSSSFLLIFLVIFPPVLISVWLIHHPCRDIVANGHWLILHPGKHSSTAGDLLPTSDSISSGQPGPGLWLTHCTSWYCNCV